ncbi:hypothetical protein K3556_07285 [Aliiroseovarius sp. M344]|uniref:hypothetical protein n=1 Tax=Aliiroseovarius sp. M344 TaxID=2867010 RepID=UPI0021ADF133|nr:hypothetical protein [Aliiroseovarius sp. M344]UWQ15667.1 hypothetical protein K3556_07285 [Aliiroseovarius sp. M344]
MTKTYTRPTKTKATAVGERNRARWTRHLRRKLSLLVSTPEVMAADETFTVDAIHRLMKPPGRVGRDDRPRWVTTRLRIDQMAVLEMLQARHLKATGKEISRAEVLAALMAEGLERILNHSNFGGTNA